MSMIRVENITFSYPSSFDPVFENVSFQIDTEWKLGLVGRNGRGKTTLLKLLLGEYEYRGKITGAVTFDYFPFPVSDKTQMTEDILRQVCPNARQWELIRELSYLGIESEVLWRPFETMSNGEQTKALLAALFLKEEHFLLIDEPTNHLDIKYQLSLLNIVKSLDLTVISAIHDLNIASMYCDRLFVMKNGKIVGSGTPQEVLTKEFIKEIYDIDVEIVNDSKGDMHILYSR